MLAFVLGSDVSVSPPKVRVPLNFVMPAVIIAVVTVVVHAAGSGKFRCFSVLPLPTSSLSYRVKILT